MSDLDFKNLNLTPVEMRKAMVIETLQKQQGRNPCIESVIGEALSAFMEKLKRENNTIYEAFKPYLNFEDINGGLNNET